MSAPSVPTGPPLGRGTVPELIEFLRTLPPEADVIDWELRTEGFGWVRLNLTVLFPTMSDERSPS